MENLTLGAAIIGLINAVRSQFPKVAGLYAIGLAVVLGAVAGYFNLFGVSGLESGIMVGLASSGAYKLATRMGGQ